MARIGSDRNSGVIVSPFLLLPLGDVLAVLAVLDHWLVLHSSDADVVEILLSVIMYTQV
ncbi:MAG: hypothetical protein PVSMB4_00320 [Ktedonobacterales bacterium]